MMGWIEKHPWMTFFLGLAALSTIGGILSPAHAALSLNLPPTKGTGVVVTDVGKDPMNNLVSQGPTGYWLPILISYSDGTYHAASLSYNLVNQGATAPDTGATMALLAVAKAQFIGQSRDTMLSSKFSSVLQ
jgi:hypothetical protein